MSGIIDQWGLVSVEGRAEGNIMTGFMRTRPDFANKHNDIYWDNASLVAISSSPPTAEPPTNTLEPVAGSPQGTNTLVAEQTPIASTPTPQITTSAIAFKPPSPTHSPPATDLSVPTLTPKPTITPGPVKSATHKATVVLTEAVTTITPASSPDTSTSSPAELAERSQSTPDPTVTGAGRIESPGSDIQQEESRKLDDRETKPYFLFFFLIGLAIAVGIVVITQIIRRNRTG